MLLRRLAFDYEITNDITVFADAKFAYVETCDIAGIPFADDLFLAADNPFIPADFRLRYLRGASLLASHGTTSPPILTAEQM